MSALPVASDRGSRPYQDVSPEETERLLALGAVVLDVRTPREHDELGHIPGALLLPLELVSAAPAVLPDDGRPVVVVCEHGVRSRQAAAYLAEAGVPACNMAGGMARWTGPREHGPSPLRGPSSWLLANALLAPRGAKTLDVACGRGRHALVLAAAGFPVRAVDRDPAHVGRLDDLARRLRLPIETRVVDLEEHGAGLGEEEWELVLVFNYLHRPLFPALVRALAPGGVLLCETYTRDQAKRGRPTSPDHLLEPGELPRLVAPLEVLRQREGEFEGRSLASVAARKRRSPPSRRTAANQAKDATSVADAPASQRRPAQRAAPSSRGPGRRTPGARKK
ncbi:MAG TPA: rhodanese-like domain-containing protein [Vicinamibacteria bacterium]|nr:rhodanese-like domain-containing protein [Vicinamibacteria bacterium]